MGSVPGSPAVLTVDFRQFGTIYLDIRVSWRMPRAQLVRVNGVKELVVDRGRPGRNFKWWTTAKGEGDYKAKFSFYQSLPALISSKLLGKPRPHIVESDPIHWDGVSDGYISFTRANLTRARASFRADAPWRVQSEQTPLPLLVQIVDPPSGGEVLKLSDIEIYDKVGRKRVPNSDFHLVNDEANNEVRDRGVPSILKRDSDGTETIGAYGRYGHQWYRIVYLDPSRLGRNRRGNIHLRVRFFFTNHSPFEMHLRVHVDENSLPKFDQDWHYGDIHFHSEHTNNPTEFGGPKTMALAAGQALGLSWVNLTDHSCDFEASEFPAMQKECRSLSKKGNFILIPSEEVTIDKPKGDYLHLLSQTSNFVEGSFYGTHTLEEVLLGRDDEKPLVDIDKGEFAFAAHPEAPKIDWEIDDKDYDVGLESPALKGLQIFNCRASKFRRLKHPDTYVNFFQFWDLSLWDRLRQYVCRRSVNFRKEWSKGLERWDDLLCQRLTKKDMKELFIAGGSDAHGDFNHGILRNALLIGNLMFDNAFGRTRTAVLLKEGEKSLELTEANILSALAKGKSVVTDGPVIDFTISDGNGNKARLGETLSIKTERGLGFHLEWITTPEFGSVRRVAVKKGFLSRDRKPLWTWLTAYKPRREENLQGSLTLHRNQNEEIAYYRVEAVSVPEWTQARGRRERYSCYTNPIWVRIASSKEA